jgi:hypothetical protein
MAVRGSVAAAVSPGFRQTAWAYLIGIAIDDGTRIAILTYAFQRYGAGGTGLAQVVLLVVATLSLTLQTNFLTRFRPFTGTRLHFSGLTAFTLGAGLAVIVDAPMVVIWLSFALVVCLCNSYRQVILSILPTIARGGRALAAQNIVMSWNESAAKIGAPILCALILSQSSKSTLGISLLFFGSSLAALSVVAVLRKQSLSEIGVATKVGDHRTTSQPAGPKESMIGILRRIRPLRTLLMLTYARFATVGASAVLYLSLAKSSGLGISRSGALSWAFGFGGLVSFFARGLVLARPKLASRLIASGCVASGAWCAIAFTTRSPIAIVALVSLSGLGAALFGVIRLTLTQRLSPPDAVMRTANAFQMSVSLGIASGALVVWAAGTVQRACLVAGLIFPVVCILTIRGLKELDGAADIPVTEIALLGRTSILRSLSPASIEALARRCQPKTFSSNSSIITQGDKGTEVFVIVDGEVDVFRDNQRLRTMGRGDIFGEIAVLSNQPRSATVKSLGTVDVLRISQDDFVTFVGLHEQVGLDVQELVSQRP